MRPFPEPVLRPIMATAASTSSRSSSAFRTGFITLIREASTSSLGSTPATGPTGATPPMPPRRNPPSPSAQTKPKRVLPPRKRQLLEEYTSLITRSEVTLFLRHGDFDTAEMNRIRSEIKKVSTPKQPSTSSPIDTSPKAKFTVVRTGLLPPVLRRLPPAHRPSREFLKTLTGSVALLTMPLLDPPTLKSVLSILSKTSSTPNARLLASQPPPPKNAPPPPPPNRLPLMSSIVSDKVYGPEEVKRLSELPSKEVLLAQIVGLIEGQGRAVLGLLQRAAGGDVVWNLEGFKKGLEEDGKVEAKPKEG